eukprot:scaffold268033_cov22-Prasinocladus_malaysianus.AAC.1
MIKVAFDVVSAAHSITIRSLGAQLNYAVCIMTEDSTTLCTQQQPVEDIAELMMLAAVHNG